MTITHYGAINYIFDTLNNEVHVIVERNLIIYNVAEKKQSMLVLGSKKIKKEINLFIQRVQSQNNT